MKKRILIIVVIITFLICASLLGAKIYQDRTNPIRNKIASIDPAEIAGCQVSWTTMYGEHYEYTETDPEIVREIYEAMAHMKFRKIKYDLPFGGPIYYPIALRPKEGKGYAIFSYSMGTVLAPGNIKYMAEITNLDELEEEYHWRTNLKNMLLSAIAAREERINAAGATEPTEATEVTTAHRNEWGVTSF